MLDHLLLSTFHILTLTCLTIGISEPCIDGGFENETQYVNVGEPMYVQCLLNYLFEKNEFNITWIRNDSQTEITIDRQARVHQDQNYLKFIPAELHDSGFYQCIVRNSTFCIMRIQIVEVFNNDVSLCYNHSVRFTNSIPIVTPSLTMECPSIDNYVKYWNTQVKWYKECQPLDLDSERFLRYGKILVIKNVSKQDSGNYTCEVPFTYNGVNYNLSRTIEYTGPAQPKNTTEPVMTYPANNILDVELGSHIELPCKVLYDGRIDTLYWTYNDKLMNSYSKERVIIGDTEKTRRDDGIEYLKTLNFTKVTEEDFNKKFYCHVTVSPSKTMFYVVLKKPDPNIQGFLIAFFVSMFLVMVITIITVRIFKVDIVLWYRSSCFANRDQTDGKMYDAYIMYPKDSTGTSSYEINRFIQIVLPEVLEKQCSYRLFIIGRDDLPGQAMADLVDETISQSRRVIIVLGNTFCEKNGADSEQKIAMYDALIRNKIKVILIEMEKITDYTNMPESIKYIKQKQGVVRWKGAFTEAALSPNTRFWKNIRYQMPPAQRHSERELDYIYSEE